MFFKLFNVVFPVLFIFLPLIALGESAVSISPVSDQSGYLRSAKVTFVLKSAAAVPEKLPAIIHGTIFRLE